MIEETRVRTPQLAAVAAEQFRTVGLAVRREVILVALLIAVPWTLLALLDVTGLLALVDDGRALRDSAVNPTPALGTVAAFLGVLFPLAVWKGEGRFEDTPLWSLPVDHRRHAVTKVAAGWAWLLLLVSASLVYLVALALASGTELGVEYVSHLIVDPTAAAAGAAGATEVVRWTTAWWEWVLPIGAASAAYLVVSALVVSTRHPVWWALGLWFLMLPIGAIGDEFEIAWAERAFALVAWPLGEWGIALETAVRLPDGEGLSALRALPSFGAWAAATVFWIAVGCAGVFAGASRPRKR